MMNQATEFYVRTSTAVRSIFDRQDGASMVEYALLIALIAVVAVSAVALFGTRLTETYSNIASSMP